MHCNALHLKRDEATSGVSNLRRRKRMRDGRKASGVRPFGGSSVVLDVDDGDIGDVINVRTVCAALEQGRRVLKPAVKCVVDADVGESTEREPVAVDSGVNGVGENRDMTLGGDEKTAQVCPNRVGMDMWDDRRELEGVLVERERERYARCKGEGAYGEPVVSESIWEKMGSIDADYMRRRELSSLRLLNRREGVKGRRVWEYSLFSGCDTGLQVKCSHRQHQTNTPEVEKEARRRVLLESGVYSDEYRSLKKALYVYLPTWLMKMLPKCRRGRIIEAAMIRGMCVDGRDVEWPMTSSGDPLDRRLMREMEVWDCATKYGTFTEMHLHPTEVLALRAFGSEMNMNTSCSLTSVVRTAVMIGLDIPGARWGITTAPWLWVSKGFPRRFDLDFLKSLMMAFGCADVRTFREGGCQLFDLILEERLREGGRRRLAHALVPPNTGVSGRGWSVRLVERMEFLLYKHVKALAKASYRKSGGWLSERRERGWIKAGEMGSMSIDDDGYIVGAA